MAGKITLTPSHASAAWVSNSASINWVREGRETVVKSPLPPCAFGMLWHSAGFTISGGAGRDAHEVSWSWT